MSDTAAASALDRYHRAYNNASYSAAQSVLLQDLYPDKPSDPEALLKQELPQTLLSLLTDAALERCGYPQAQGKSLILIRVLLDAGLGPSSIQACAKHLQNFDASEDWLHLGVCLYLERQSQKHLKLAIENASAIHSAAGNIAYDFLVSAASLQKAATAVLAGESVESLNAAHSGLRQVFYALKALQEFKPGDTRIRLTRSHLEDEKVRSIHISEKSQK